MASRGDSETTQLKKNLEDQLDRLMNQLKDIEELKSELDEDEYEETKKETMEQLDEFQKSLQKMVFGNLSLVDDINSMQLAIQAAITKAFKTPEVIRMFAKKQPDDLRQRLSQIQRDVKVKKIPDVIGNEQIVEVLLALKKLGEPLSGDDEQFLQIHANAQMKEFQQVDSTAMLSHNQLLARIRRLESHVTQLRNIISKRDKNSHDDLTSIELPVLPKEVSENRRSRRNKQKQRPFDFDKCFYRHVALHFLYVGWDYNGFVTQEDSEKTIEAELFRSLIQTRLIESRELSNYHRCGRTDKGVSSFGQVISIDLRSKLTAGAGVFCRGELDASNEAVNDTISLPPEELDYVKMLNAVLPPEIRVIAWAPAPRNFSARFDCTSRTYRYFFPRSDLDLDLMNDSAQRLLGEHDYRNFCKMDVVNNVTNYIRRIDSIGVYSIEGTADGPYQMCELRLRGAAFLWHQVRCIVSILFLIGQRREAPTIIDDLLDIEKTPRKPQYALASHLPLNLFKCDYGHHDLALQCTSDNRLQLIKHMQGLWSQQAVKASMLREVCKKLEHQDFSDPSHGETNTGVPGRYDATTGFKGTFSQLDVLSPECRVAVKNYRSLTDRPVCESLEERLEGVAKRRKMTSGL